MISSAIEKAQNIEKAFNTLKIQLSKAGNTEFEVTEVNISLRKIPFIKVSKVNEIRRVLAEKLRKIRTILLDKAEGYRHDCLQRLCRI